MKRRNLLTATLFIAAASSACQAYITSHAAVPVKRQIEFLKELTANFCESQIGELTESDISQAPTLMYAWSHLRRTSGTNNNHRFMDHAIEIEKLLKRLVDERRAGNDQAIVTVQDYNCVLEGWARSGAGPAAAERCEQILRGMQEEGDEVLQPDLSSYKAVLMAWRQQKTMYAPYRAQRVLESMIQQYNEGKNAEAPLPDADCFDIVLQTWSRSGHKQAPRQTERILGAMERLYESTGMERLKPRCTSFNAVLSAWAKAGKSPERALEILDFMELLKTNGETNVGPDTASYCIVMGALAHDRDQVNAAQKADSLLKRAEAAYHRDRSVVPDTILFNTAIGCWTKANISGGWRKAQSILDRQKALYEDGCHSCKPDVFGYTSVIATCANEKGSELERSKAFNQAMSTMKQMELDDQVPNHVTYGAMMKACAKLLPSNSQLRRKMVRRYFHKCCEAGFAGDVVINRLREAATPDIYGELVGSYSGKKKLPAEWSRNVVENQHSRQRGGSSHRNTNRKRAEV